MMNQREPTVPLRTLPFFIQKQTRIFIKKQTQILKKGRVLKGTVGSL
jgi:hypothetical protein